MKHLWLLTLLALVFCAGQATGAQIVRVGANRRLVQLSHDERIQWAVHDLACLFQDNQPVCARVILTAEKGALAKFQAPVPKLAKGMPVTRQESLKRISEKERMETARRERDESERTDWDGMIAFYRELGVHNEGKQMVVLPTPKRLPPPLGFPAAKPRAPRKSVSPPPAAVEKPAASVEVVAPAPLWYPKREASFGMLLVYPTLSVQLPIGRRFSVGILGSYYSFYWETSSNDLYGGLVSLRFYSRERFQGLWLQAGAGLYSGSFESPTGNFQAASYSVLGTAGWRFLWKQLSFGAAAGIQWFRLREASPYLTRQARLTPTLLMEIGWAF